MTEIWKDIEGYDGKYQVSNLGRVRSVDHITTDVYNGKERKRPFRGKILKQYVLPSGYVSIHFVCYKPLLVHRAVAKAFVPGYFDGAQVNHKDENKQNNRYDNLEWVTPKENANYGNRNKKCQNAANKQHGYVVEQYSTTGELVSTFPSQRAAAKSIGATARILNLRIDTDKPVNGYLFKRKNK